MVDHPGPEIDWINPVVSGIGHASAVCRMEDAFNMDIIFRTKGENKIGWD
jgi:hypothetical protein